MHNFKLNDRVRVDSENLLDDDREGIVEWVTPDVIGLRFITGGGQKSFHHTHLVKVEGTPQPEPKKIDWTKPIQTDNGYPLEYVGQGGGFHVVISPMGNLYKVSDTGKYAGCEGWVKNVPPKPVTKFLNIYANGHTTKLHDTVELAKAEHLQRQTFSGNYTRNPDIAVAVPVTYTPED